MANNVKFIYDDEGDVLEIMISRSTASVGRELGEDIIEHYDPVTKEIVGYTVLNFFKRFKGRDVEKSIGEFIAMLRARNRYIGEVLTLQEAADYLKTSTNTLYSLVNEGKLPAAKIGREWRFSKRAIERYLAGESRSPGG